MKQIFKIVILPIIMSNNLGAIEMIKLDTEKVNNRVFAEDCPKCQLIPVSLDILISEIVKNNYDLNSKKMQIDIASHQTKIEEGIFEPILNLEADYIRTKVPNSAEEAVSRSDMSLYKEKKYFATGGVKGLLEIGTEWSINITDGNKNSNLISETRDYDREFDNGIEFSIKQPLLKGFGKDMTAIKINLAKQNETIVLKEYNAKLMDTITSVVKTYWTLYGTQKLYESWKNSLIVAKKGLENIKLLAKNGKIPQTEILEVRSAILDRRTKILSLKSKIIELQDKILSLLNLSVIENPNTIFIATDLPHIEKKTYIEPLNISFEKALNNLPEFELIKLRYKQEKIRNEYSQNQLLPDLSLQAGVNTSGLRSLDSQARKDAFSDKYVSYNVGLTLEMPIGGNQKAKENLTISKLKLLDKKLEIASSKKMLNNILNTKREQLINQQDRLDLHKENMDYHRHLLEIELKKLRSGRADIRDVFDYEEKVISSQRTLLNSIISWKLAQAMLDKSTGDLLDEYNIKIDKNRNGLDMIKNKFNKKLNR